MTVSVIGGFRQQEAREGRGKTPSVRLLDLLAGWSAFVSDEEENGAVDPALSAEEIGALYQSAGELGETGRGISRNEEEEAVRTFVEQRLLPLLLRKSEAA